MTVVTALCGGQKQADFYEFKANLGYIVRPCPNKMK